MNRASLRLGFLLLALNLNAAPKEELVSLFESRRVTVNIPDGFVFMNDHDADGVIVARLNAPADGVSLQIIFLPDASGRFNGLRERAEFLVERFENYVGDSTEKAMQFEELEPRLGRGTYCSFTDAKLLGKKDLPAGEYLHATVGVKVWPGVFAVFTLFSNDLKSKNHLAAMDLLRDSVHEKPGPLR